MKLRAMVVAAAVLVAGAARGQERAIYGDDDRRELDDPANTTFMMKAAKAVAVIVPRDQVQPHTSQTSQLPRLTLGAKYNLCASEPFLDQPAPGYCTGFLVASDKLVTAGHCIRSAADCSHAAIVFGFSASVDGTAHPEVVRSDDVYSCRSLEAHVLDSATGVDFALLRLDRPAYGRPVLKPRRKGWLSDTAALTVIHHPAGLPVKISAGGAVRANAASGYFVTNLDTFSGSSGAPVLNDRSGEVEGILVRGDKDWVTTTDGCRVAKRCEPDACRGEDATRITAVLDYLP